MLIICSSLFLFAGSRSNALTDFQHTIYHIHSPVKLEDGRGMYLPALEALNEIAFAPEMLPHRIEKDPQGIRHGLF